jgi:hypothetical protein
MVEEKAKSIDQEAKLWKYIPWKVIGVACLKVGRKQKPNYEREENCNGDEGKIQ